jgi:integrase/recombinase XerD
LTLRWRHVVTVPPPHDALFRWPQRLDRKYRKCNCPIHVEGKCGEEFIRKNRQTSNWQRAQQRVMEAEARGSWEPPPQDKYQQPITIADAKARFLKDAESGRRLGESTLKKYKLMLKHLEQFAAKKGFVYLKQFDSDTLRDFRDSRQLGPRTALKKLERVKAFFRFAAENNWIIVNPAKIVRGPANVRDTHKLPYEPAEMDRIIRACHEIRFQNFSNEEVLAFVLLLRYSGLRIGDASMLTIDRFKGDDLYLYTQRSGTHVYVPLPPFVMNTIRGMKLQHGKYLFTGPGSLRMETASDMWRRRLGQVFNAAKVTGAHPHRFRHTFGVELLKKGVPMEEVSILLGNSSIRITEKHYASWVPARQEILKSHVAKTWETFGVIEGGQGEGQVTYAAASSAGANATFTAHSLTSYAIASKI